MADDSSFSENEGYLLEEQETFTETPTPDFDKHYRYVKNLIFDGFIPFHVKVFGVPCVFKALTLAEFRYIEILASDPIQRIPYYFLYSIAFIDGCCLLDKREDLHEEIVDLWKKLPISVTNVFVDIIQALQNVQSDCFGNLEGYLYENESRFIWLVNKDDAVKNKLMKGYERIGLNTAQESWIAFNKREDVREEQERLFEHSKFIVSGFVGSKEIRKIESSEKQRQRDERKRRQDIRLKNTKKDTFKRLSAPINTVEDIISELERQIRGEKDEHDRIIDQHEQRLREMKERRLLEIQQAIERSKYEEDLSGSKPISSEEMRHVIENTRTTVDLSSHEKITNYLDKIEKTALTKTNTIGDMKPKSIFDSDVQEELKKINLDR